MKRYLEPDIMISYYNINYDVLNASSPTDPNLDGDPYRNDKRWQV